MVIFFFITLMLIPATLVGFGLLWRKHPPKTINFAYGYRTSWSMKSQETWNFAHKYAGKIWLYTGIPLGILSAVVLIIYRNLDLEKLGQFVIILNIIQLVGLFSPIIPTEIALRKRFDKNGNRKESI
ncbi:MAG: SdpI family protein [Bacillota bacterium]